jgi:formylglycine-generating enzyme required for sulfatase activity
MYKLATLMALLFFISCNVIKTITPNDTKALDDFFSNPNKPQALTTSNIFGATAAQDIETFITLPYTGDTTPTNCTASNLSNVTNTTPCTCVSATCTIGLTGTTGYYGSASADFSLSNNEETSNSSTISISIDFACPAGYIRVPAMAAVNAPNDFCVMKYEAKNSIGNAVSTDTGAPWVSINQPTAKTECTDLGANYDLISNPEWMAIARNVENVPSNWTNNGVGDGCLKRGNIGGVNACTGGDSGYDGADPEAGTGRNALASLTLNNGEVIWDLSGNVWEWTNWTLGGSLSTDMSDAQKASSGGSTVAAWIEYTAVDNFPANSPAIALLPDNPSFDADEGMGRYYSGTGGGAALRGGKWSDHTNAGAFALGLSYPSSLVQSYVGFRCVFRP